jgi:hypothetical protein
METNGPAARTVIATVVPSSALNIVFSCACGRRSGRVRKIAACRGLCASYATDFRDAQDPALRPRIIVVIAGTGFEGEAGAALYYKNLLQAAEGHSALLPLFLLGSAVRIAIIAGKEPGGRQRSAQTLLSRKHSCTFERRTFASNPVHSIISSAVARSVWGTVRPSALAVLRLMANLYWSVACTGRSPGFEPLRMRST